MPDTTLSVTALADQMDTQFHAVLARQFSPLSPAATILAISDWALHLCVSPGKCMELAYLAMSQAQDLARYACERMIAGPDRQVRDLVQLPALDRRFNAPEWQRWPFNYLHQAFLLKEQWWEVATHGVKGVEVHHQNLVAFAMRQWLDIFSPGNHLPSNPVVLRRTLQQGGMNLLRGMQYMVEDLLRLATNQPEAGTENFVVGRDVAVTPGKVVLRNDLIELIQYRSATAAVYPEPILIVPAWIMKYYILDLSQTNSLIRYLVDQGHTVFCISWKNPGYEDRGLGMDDYLGLGFHAALDAVNTIVPGQKVHAAGYCLGGTMLAIAAAAMARDGDDRLASMTLFAGQTDFSEPGELGLFIDETQLNLLEAQMADTGYLKASQMAGAFQMLRSYDMLWSRLVNEYLLGERPPMNDLMAWNADATRMPAKMHSQYLRRLFLNDDLSEGRYPVGGRPVSLGNLQLPIFMVGTVTDHVAPWRSVFKLHQMSPAEITFVLTTGGHNAGIVNPPGNPRHHHQLLTRPAGGSYVAPDEWLQTAPETQGSWWPAWQAWLQVRSGSPGKPPRTGERAYRPVCDAPGTYVMER